MREREKSKIAQRLRKKGKKAGEEKILSNM